MNEEDDLLFGVQPSPPSSPRTVETHATTNQNYFQSCQQDEEPKIESAATLKVYLGLECFEHQYNPDTETIAVAKTRIAKSLFKDSISLMFEGKTIEDERLTRDVDSETSSKQSKIYVIVNKPEIKAEQNQIRTNPIVQPQIQPRPPVENSQPVVNLTRDEIVVTQQFLNYERKLFKEYQKQVKLIEQTSKTQHKKRKSSESDGHIQQNQIDTNMSAQQNFLMTHLPIMDYSFQKRMGIYTASEQIRQNMEEYINGGQNIRFLGYDSILQPTILFKLIGFMIIFGMNAPGKLKWVCIAFLVIYYFFYVRSLYQQHFQQQRALLNLNQRRNNQPARQPQVNNQGQNDIQQADQQVQINVQILDQRGGLIQELDQQGNFINQLQVPQNRDVNKLYLIGILVYYFFLSLNHDWMNPILRQFADRRAEIARALAQRNQKRLERRLKKKEQREAELKKKMEEALLIKEQLSKTKQSNSQVHFDDFLNFGEKQNFQSNQNDNLASNTALLIQDDQRQKLFMSPEQQIETQTESVFEKAKIEDSDPLFDLGEGDN